MENFKDKNEGFFYNSTSDQLEEEDDKQMRSMFSLFQATNISFPGEKVMDEAKEFTTDYLREVLGRDVIDIDQSLLRKVNNKK